MDAVSCPRVDCSPTPAATGSHGCACAIYKHACSKSEGSGRRQVMWAASSAR